MRRLDGGPFADVPAPKETEFERTARHSLTFDQRFVEICHWVDKRRAQWQLNVLEWDDARQIILSRIHQQYHFFDPERGEFRRWVNHVISNKIKSLWRDHYTKYSRPCILGCIHNTGTDNCDRTKSGKQCAECPAYKDWQRRKESQFNIKQTLPMENHTQEVSNAASENLDIAAAKKVIDAKMKEKLTKTEWKVYRLLIVQGKSEREVAKAMGFKDKNGKGKREKMYGGYLRILSLKHVFVKLAKEIISSENLA